jgi:hypothetical protein
LIGSFASIVFSDVSRCDLIRCIHSSVFSNRVLRIGNW